MIFTTALIALLINLGIITSAADVNNLTPEQEAQIEMIIIEDTDGL